MTGSVATAAVADRHPIALVVDDDLRRNRVTVFFRLLLAIPQVVWLYFFGIGRRSPSSSRGSSPYSQVVCRMHCTISSRATSV